MSAFRRQLDAIAIVPPDTALISAVRSLSIQTESTARQERLLYWVTLPNVTLGQAAWLLLDIDPFVPPEPTPARSTASPHYQHASVLNRLECELPSGRLKPLGREVPGTERRFSLQRISALAVDLNICQRIAGEILSACAFRSPKPEKETPTSRMTERYSWHRKFVFSRHLSQVEPIKSPKIKRPRRKHVGSPVSMRVAMKAYEYDAQFTAYVTHQFGRPSYKISPSVMKADRRALNIKLQAGRPPKYPNK